jgi:hypothetical protein
VPYINHHFNQPPHQTLQADIMADNGDTIDFKLFRYDPNLGAAVFFVILFAAASALHTYQYLVTKTWFFTAFVIGCWCKSSINQP